MPEEVKGKFGSLESCVKVEQGGEGGVWRGTGRCESGKKYTGSPSGRHHLSCLSLIPLFPLGEKHRTFCKLLKMYFPLYCLEGISTIANCQGHLQLSGESDENKSF